MVYHHQTSNKLVITDQSCKNEFKKTIVTIYIINIMNIMNRWMDVVQIPQRRIILNTISDDFSIPNQ